MSGIGRKIRPILQWQACIPDYVIALAWSPDNRLVAAAATTGSIAILDAASGAVRHMMPGHSFGTTSIAWADASTVASAGQDGRIRLWDTTSGAASWPPAAARWLPFGIAQAKGPKTPPHYNCRPTTSLQRLTS